MRAMPAQFQNSAVASSATATNAPPMAAARAPTATLSCWPSKVPTFSKMLAAQDTAGINIPARPKAATIFFTGFPPPPDRLTNDDESSALRTLARLDHEDVDAADDVLPVARDQIPARLPIIGI